MDSQLPPKPFSNNDPLTDFKKLLSRRLPTRGPTGLTLFIASFSVVGYGIYRVLKGRHREDLLEEEADRLHLTIFPVLSAMEDRKYLRWEKRANEKEAEIMKNVPGWVVGENLYKTRWMRRSLTWDPSDDVSKSSWGIWAASKYGLKDSIRGQRKYLRSGDAAPQFPAKDV